MKKLLFLLFIPFGLSAQDVSFTFQPTDLGIGLRYDQKGKEAGWYGSMSYGNYNFIGGEIKDHIKISFGGTIYQKYSFLTFGPSFHHYGETKGEFNHDALSPFGLELGAGTYLDRFSFAIRMDVIKWESSLDFGLRF